MFWSKWLLFLVWCLLLILAGFWFASENSAEVVLNLFGMLGVSRPLGVVVVVCLLIGFVLGLLTLLLPLGFKSFFRAKKIAKMECEIQALKASLQARDRG